MVCRIFTASVLSRYGIHFVAGIYQVCDATYADGDAFFFVGKSVCRGDRVVEYGVEFVGDALRFFVFVFLNIVNELAKRLSFEGFLTLVGDVWDHGGVGRLLPSIAVDI